MPDQGKKAVHISWEQAHRAEAERDKARQTRCQPIPPTRIKLTTTELSRRATELKAGVLHFRRATYIQGSGTSGCKAIKPFSPELVRSIAAYSKRLLELLKIVCDKILLVIPLATPKQTVSVKLAEEMTQQGNRERRTETVWTKTQSLKNRHEAEPKEARRARFGDPFFSLGDKGSKNYFKHLRLTRPATATFFYIILLAGIGMFSYLQRGKNNLSDPALNSEAADPAAMARPPIQPVAPQPSSTIRDPAATEARERTAEKTQNYLGSFEVVEDSFVRDKPQSNATIIATLRPGTQVRVESKTGEYLHIRSLSDADVIGYVHEEDAFFQAHLK